ncbi:MFS transporter [Micromonospora aurantiaca (nom. illeg.)]|uniref:MFS transporter n=1 Tax=Micromonospora aurantiaca (nom. illeg.) TaxID=47850 RepID=UPI0033C54AED
MTPAMLLPYRPVLGQPVLRRLLPGLATSALGDGLALVAVTWLALQLAPDGQRGTWTAFAVAAYTLPGAAGTLLLGRWLGARSGAQLAGWDATVRAAALGAIPVAHLAGVLDVGLYVALLAVSSLLHPWGSAGRFTLVAELLPQRHHLAANALLGVFGQAATIVGPPLAGLLIAWAGAVWVIAVDAASFAVLAVSYRLVVPAVRREGAARREGAVRREGAHREPAVRHQAGDQHEDGERKGGDQHEDGDRHENPTAGPSRTSGFRIIGRDRSLLGLLALTFAFFFLFGPFYVAMPVHVTDDLHASAGTLAAYYTAFGVGSLLGGLLTGHLRGRPLRTTLTGIVVLFGAALMPLGLGAPVVLSLPAFALAGLVWAPYQPTATALFQRRSGTVDLPRVLAANGAVTVLAVPLGTMLGGPATAAFGARPTLLTCAVTILALGLVAAVSAARPGPGAHNTEQTGPAGPHDRPGPQTTGPHDRPGPHDQPEPHDRSARVKVPDRVRPGAS